MEIIPTTDVPASDQLIDEIASIEMQRQEKEKEAGLAASCSGAIGRLHKLLDREKEALQLPGSSAGHPANFAAVTIEIERVKRLAVLTSPASGRTSPYPGQRKASWQNAQRSPARNKGRRTMGRAGGR